MQVAALLQQIEVCLVSYDQFVAPVADVDGLCIDLVAVADVYPVEVTTHQDCHRICRTVGESCIHHLLLVGVLQAPRHVSPPGDTIRTSQHRGLYC